MLYDWMLPLNVCYLLCKYLEWKFAVAVGRSNMIIVEVDHFTFCQELNWMCKIRTDTMKVNTALIVGFNFWKHEEWGSEWDSEFSFFQFQYLNLKQLLFFC